VISALYFMQGSNRMAGENCNSFLDVNMNDPFTGGVILTYCTESHRLMRESGHRSVSNLKTRFCCNSISSEKFFSVNLTRFLSLVQAYTSTHKAADSIAFNFKKRIIIGGLEVSRKE